MTRLALFALMLALPMMADAPTMSREDAHALARSAFNCGLIEGAKAMYPEVHLSDSALKVFEHCSGIERQIGAEVPK